MPEGTNRKTGLTANGAKNAKPKEKPFAVTLGVEPGRIAKTLSVRVKDQALLVVAWGDARLDNRKTNALGGRPRIEPTTRPTIVMRAYSPTPLSRPRSLARLLRLLRSDWRSFPVAVSAASSSAPTIASTSLSSILFE